MESEEEVLEVVVGENEGWKSANGKVRNLNGKRLGGCAGVFYVDEQKGYASDDGACKA